jgi:hypothetical protein
MTSIWTNLTASALALAPGMASLQSGSGRDDRAPASGSSASPSLSAQEAGLRLALEQGQPGHMPDFLFKRTLGLDSQVSIWHPDPRCHGRLDQNVLETMIEAMANGQISDEETSATLVRALSGECEVRSLEVRWLDNENVERCWLLSTSYDSESQSGAIVTGLVRDVSIVHSHYNEISARLENASRGEHALTASTTNIAETVREQALLISGICDLLAQPVDQLSGDGECKRHEFVVDVRQAVRQIVINAELLKDYTHARQGTLALTPQTWSADELMSIISPMLNDLLAGSGVSLKVQPQDRPAALVCDPYRLARFLYVEMAPVCSALSRGSTVRLSAGPAAAGEVVFELACQTEAATEPNSATAARGLSAQHCLHPTLSQAFRETLLAAHDADVSLQAASNATTRLAITLRNLAEARST